MVRLSCPVCECQLTVASLDAGATCPACGSTVHDPASRTEWDADEPEHGLIADIREAFGTEIRSADSGGLTWPEGCPDAEGAGANAGLHPMAIGSRLDDFEIGREIGRGGMGIVYRARQLSLNREVALKVLPPALQRHRSALDRFRREAQAVARLKHPNVVSIYAQGEHDGHLYYAMELIDGVSLDVAIRRRPEMLSSSFWSTNRESGTAGQRCSPESRGPKEPAAGRRKPPEVLDRTPPLRTIEDFRHLARLASGAADGLAHAASHGVIHRDIKPQNLLLGTDGVIHITDFGLAHLADEPHLTMGGEVLGTAAYLSPEQLCGDTRRIDQRTDVYSLGATLFELLTHRRPFDGESRDRILSDIRTVDPPRPRRLDKRIPRDLETICLRAMEKDPKRRYQSAASMAADLRRFADDRPILSRASGPLEICVKSMRRRRAVTAAVAIAVVAAAFATAWLVTAAHHRDTEAAELLRDAYERLAFVDYRAPELVADQVDRAEALGADPDELRITRALLDLGRLENGAAEVRLREAVAENPEDQRALYLLAWALWRSGDQRASQDAFARAEALGEPTFAEDWFFRGLAAHFERPTVAVDSYRAANALRARDREFYPQAILHLARAHNQEMYVTRRADLFVEAQSGLGQLIEHGHYGAYPYYLLSIAHRLAGEIAATGPDAATASDDFTRALQWARAGQAVEPADDRTVTAEAECLESMGLFTEAIAARTRALALADRPREQWEAYHYRWRLNYWTGQFEAALADLHACLTFSPGNRFYTFVYPALLRAEMGDIEEARVLALRIAETAPTDAQAVLWSATTLNLLGAAGDAYGLLVSARASVDFAAAAVPPQTPEWVSQWYACVMGEAEWEELLRLAEGVPVSRKLVGEAHFHAGAKALGRGDRDLAREHLTAAYGSFDSEHAYTFHAKTIIQRMRHRPDWPPWLGPPISNEGAD